MTMGIIGKRRAASQCVLNSYFNATSILGDSNELAIFEKVDRWKVAKDRTNPASISPAH